MEYVGFVGVAEEDERTLLELIGVREVVSSTAEED